MEVKNFWLIFIDESQVQVSLVANQDGAYQLKSIGPLHTWQSRQPDTLLTSTDNSLSQAAAVANLPSDQEPSLAALIVPPFWVGSDGKIVDPKLHLMEHLCKNLKLKPMGFIPSDEAIVEEANSKDGFPASFILVQLGVSEMILSLVYLGKIKHRVRKNLEETPFGPSLLEKTLIELNTDSTLPPQIIIYGNVCQENVDGLVNYPWTGKKDVETFLHYPDVKSYEFQDIVKIFTNAIISQIQPQVNTRPDADTQSDLQDAFSDSPSPDPDLEPQAEDLQPSSNLISEVDAHDLGFSSTPPQNPQPNLADPSKSFDVSLEDQQLEIPTFPPVKVPKKFPQIKLSLPRPKISFKIPKISPKKGTLFLVPAIIFLLFIASIYLFSSADVVVFATPFNFNKSVSVKLDPQASEFDLNSNIIPVTKKTFEITQSSSVATTGQKTIGEHAKGSIVVFNKQDESKTLPKGTILSDPSGKKFELTSTVIIASSSADLDRGVINLGQTKAVVSAVQIGPEYNIAKDTQLKFTDISENILVAKSADPFTGGSKQDIRAVSSEDKISLEQEMDQNIAQSIEDKINQDVAQLSGVLPGTIQTQKGRIEYNREVGEEAEELTGSAVASVTVFILDPQQKTEIIRSYLSTMPDFDQAQIDPQNFSLNFTDLQASDDVFEATVEITGQALPALDLESLKTSLKGKPKSRLSQLIKQKSSRIYDFNLKTNFSFLSGLNPLPFRVDNIKIELKTE